MVAADIILAVNSAGILAIGGITFFIIYSTFQGIEDSKIKEFSKRFLMLTAVMILNSSYLLFYTEFFADPNNLAAIFPFYVLLALTFILLIYSAMAFEEVADAHGLSNKEKIEKMEKETRS